jgi:hypothetical protein
VPRDHAWLSDEEVAEVVGDLRETFMALMKQQPSPERRPYRASVILFPTE